MVESSNSITFVVGPTAAGKSNWALSEALKSGGIIANADSVQIYKGLNIGAAKPSAIELSQIPHFLYDIVSPLESFTAGDFRRKALSLIEEKIKSQPIFFVGGSGFYIQALEKGMFEVAPIPAQVKIQIEQIKAQNRLFEELKFRDLKSAIKIGSSDPYRLERALELVLSEGRSVDAIRAEFEQKNQLLSKSYKIRKVGLFVDRESLRKRVLERTQNMLDAGLVTEVEGLLKAGFADTKALKSIGYKEVVAYLSGSLKREELVPAIVTSTMQLAKRQMTWFKRDLEIEWLVASS